MKRIVSLRGSPKTMMIQKGMEDHHHNTICPNAKATSSDSGTTTRRRKIAPSSLDSSRVRSSRNGSINAMVLMASMMLVTMMASVSSGMVLGIDMGASFMKVALVKPGSPFQVRDLVRAKSSTRHQMQLEYFYIFLLF